MSVTSDRTQPPQASISKAVRGLVKPPHHLHQRKGERTLAGALQVEENKHEPGPSPCWVACFIPGLSIHKATLKLGTSAWSDITQDLLLPHEASSSSCLLLPDLQNSPPSLPASSAQPCPPDICKLTLSVTSAIRTHPCGVLKPLGGKTCILSFTIPRRVPPGPRVLRSAGLQAETGPHSAAWHDEPLCSSG